MLAFHSVSLMPVVQMMNKVSSFGALLFPREWLRLFGIRQDGKRHFLLPRLFKKEIWRWRLKKERKSMFPGSYDIEYALRVHSEMETQVRLLVVWDSQHHSLFCVILHRQIFLIIHILYIILSCRCVKYLKNNFPLWK